VIFTQAPARLSRDRAAVAAEAALAAGVVRSLNRLSLQREATLARAPARTCGDLGTVLAPRWGRKLDAGKRAGSSFLIS
jgi:hypothetical protein